MSRGFVKESDFEEAPVIPQRAELPAGATNYVTARGLRLLHEEYAALEAERIELATKTDNEARRQLIVVEGKMRLLQGRIASARPLEAEEVDTERVRFGATVTFSILDGPIKGQTRTLTIVGVDEANVREKRIAFVSPLARALTGTAVGETATLELGARKQRMIVKAIVYEKEPSRT